VEEEIKSRAKVLKSKFPELSYEDLVQDGYTLVLGILSKGGENAESPSYIFKAINNHYSRKMRRTVDERRRTESLESLIDKENRGRATLPSTDGGIAVANARINSKSIADGDVYSMQNSEVEVYNLLKAGVSREQIPDILGLSGRQFKEVLKNLKSKGKDWLNEEE
jgi:DNA-binding CsgD family transcriptional regulator